MRKGLLISFEGLDYSFKETNTKRLYSFIKNNITDKVELLSFPNYDDLSSTLVKSYLAGEFGDASELDPYQTSIFYAADRVSTLLKHDIKRKLEEGYIIILDRYTGSNMIFQSTKIEEPNCELSSRSSNINNFIDWVIELEYNNLKLPIEDITIYMDMPIDISYNLFKGRDSKTSTDIDGHEDNYKFMKNVERTALNYVIPTLRRRDFNYQVVQCTTELNEIKNREEMFNDIMEHLLKHLQDYCDRNIGNKFLTK